MTALFLENAHDGQGSPTARGMTPVQVKKQGRSFPRKRESTTIWWRPAQNPSPACPYYRSCLFPSHYVHPEISGEWLRLEDAVFFSNTIKKALLPDKKLKFIFILPMSYLSHKMPTDNGCFTKYFVINAAQPSLIRT
jgi:hypothetical protein